MGQGTTAYFYSGIGKNYADIQGVKYNDDGGNKFIASIPGYPDVNMNIGESQVKVSTPTATPEPTATPTPAPAVASGLIVKSSSIGTDSVNAGDEFTLSLTIYATTSGNTSANDVVVAVTPDKGVVITSGSSTGNILRSCAVTISSA